MKTVPLSEDTVEILIDAARLGCETMEQEYLESDDRYERNNIASRWRRALAAIGSAERMTIGVEFETKTAQDMSAAAETKRVMEDYSDSKTNWFEGKR